MPPTFRLAFDGHRSSGPWRLAGKTLTLRADAASVTVWYGRHRVARPPRPWRRGQERVTPAHAEGLAAHTPGAPAPWQVAAVEGRGAQARRSLALLRAGTRSLRAEVDPLLLLPTLYGPAAGEAALGALRAQGIVGSDPVEQGLKLQQAPAVAPPPRTLGDPRLSVPPVRPTLQRSEALLRGADPPPGEAEPEGAADA